MVDFLNQALEVVKAESLDYFKETEFNVKNSVESVVGLFQAQVKIKGIKVNVYSPSVNILSSQQGFEKILLHLIANAIKFTNEGSVDVSVCLTDSKLNIVVSDTGIGIAKKYHKAIFDKFYKIIPAYMEPDYNGCGTGLYVAKKIVEKMKGRIIVESAAKKGARFEVSLPVYKYHNHLIKKSGRLILRLILGRLFLRRRISFSLILFPCHLLSHQRQCI